MTGYFSVYTKWLTRYKILNSFHQNIDSPVSFRPLLKGAFYLDAQSCLTLCNPMDFSLPGFSVHRVFQVRILEWATFPFSRGSYRPRDCPCIFHSGRRVLFHWAIREAKGALLLLLLLLSCFSHVRLCATPETAAHQVPWSLGFSRQEHWSGLPFPSPMHESEKWKWSCSVVSNSSQPHGLQPTTLLCPWDFPGKSTSMAIKQY